MAKEPIVIFVEDYKNMSKEEFAIYIKKIWKEGYEAGKADNYYPWITCTNDNIHIKGNTIDTTPYFTEQGLTLNNTTKVEK